ACEEIRSPLVVSSCDGAELLQLTEEVLDEMAGGIEVVIIWTRFPAPRHRWNHRGFSGAQERLDHSLVGIESFVGEQSVGLHVRQEDVGAFEVVGLARCQQKCNRIAQSVDHGMNLRAQSASAAPNRFVAL